MFGLCTEGTSLRLHLRTRIQIPADPYPSQHTPACLDAYSAAGREASTAFPRRASSRTATTAPAASASSRPTIRRKPVPVRASTTPAAFSAPASSWPPSWRTAVPPPEWRMPASPPDRGGTEPVRAATAPAAFARPTDPWVNPARFKRSCPDWNTRPWDCQLHRRTPFSWGKWTQFMDESQRAMACFLPDTARTVSCGEWIAMPPFAQKLYSWHESFGKGPRFYLNPNIKYNTAQQGWRTRFEDRGEGNGGWLIRVSRSSMSWTWW